MTYPFTYEAVIYIDDDEYIIECGLGLATGFADAARIIEQRYDPDLICIKNLELLEADTAIIVSKEVKDKIIKEEYINETIRCDAYGNIIDPVEKFISDFINDTEDSEPTQNKAYQDTKHPDFFDYADATAEEPKSRKKVDSL